ncbi:MAG: alpha/beta hydrolase [Eubacteriales bacterium]|nr:alpha/beta hydrolase [Eubacteriales bacterium]
MDIRLNYFESGIGEPFILLHGNGENYSYFKNQIAFFSKKYRVIAIDTRGHGKSPRGKAPFTIRQFAEDLHDFMNEHDIEAADILGFSDGGNIALAFALKYPERVKHLILNGANLYPLGVKRHVQIPIEIGYRMASLFAAKSEDARKNAEMLGLMVNEPMITPRQLNGLHVRTLVIAGTKDMIRENHTRLIYDSLPDAELAFIAGDHFIANKNSESFNFAVAAFLSKENAG